MSLPPPWAQIGPSRIPGSSCSGSFPGAQAPRARASRQLSQAPKSRLRNDRRGSAERSAWERGRLARSGRSQSEERAVISLVTGAGGFLGSHLTRLLVEQGHQVRVLVRPRSETRALAGLPVERVCGDLRDTTSLVAAVQGVQRVFDVAAVYLLWAPNTEEIDAHK